MTIQTLSLHPRLRRATRGRQALPALWLTALFALASPQGLADDHWRDLHEAVRRGQLVALPQVLDWLEARYEGQILEVELERDDGRPVYEIEMLGPQGQIVEFEFDARSGELIGMEGVNIDGMRRKEEAR
ncbi:MAG: PepSY domain-containing protein [Halomonas sp.]|nr:PepSY domain-containing protein [Halomonas sp.]MDX5502008.1 PepSY domain-containing protein [Halomonas sp.]